VIGLSGLILWFPWFFTRFFPGSLLNIATIVHGEEALLAVGFIFTFHFFHNHLRPENFPMDTVIFTGKMTLERFREERPAEYARLVEEGRLEEILTDPPTPLAQRLSFWFGLAALITGLVIVLAIFTTLLL
jgi:cytochrome b subunit of formate dehydrogenase